MFLFSGTKNKKATTLQVFPNKFSLMTPVLMTHRRFRRKLFRWRVSTWGKNSTCFNACSNDILVISFKAVKFQFLIRYAWVSTLETRIFLCCGFLKSQNSVDFCNVLFLNPSTNFSLIFSSLFFYRIIMDFFATSASKSFPVADQLRYTFT